MPVPNGSRHHAIWLLRLVPPGPLGRPLAAAVLLALTLPVFAVSGAFGGLFAGGQAWAAALFFCVILAYITPVFHFVTERTEYAFDALVPHLRLDGSDRARLRGSIRHKSPRWVVGTLGGGVAVWLLQSWVLAGGGSGMFAVLVGDPLNVTMAVAPLFVWCFMICAVTALVDNALLFRRLAGCFEVDLLDPRAVTPFGDMAASSILVLIGALASLAIMWLDGGTNPWTTIPGAVLLLGALVFLTLATLGPIHRVLRDARREELTRVQRRIDAVRAGVDTLDEQALARLEPLLAYRREIVSLREWPLDPGVLTRFGLYLFIVPLTWVGAALIEYLVGLFIEG